MDLHNLITQKFKIREDEGKNKISNINDVIKDIIKPNMSIYFGGAHARPVTALYELARLFNNKSPNFTLITLSACSYIAVLFSLGLIKKIITTFWGDTYPAFSPSPVFQKLYKDKKIEIENWSILTLTLRLMAEAMNLQYLPTKSLIGSSMIDENKDSVKVINDKICLVKALSPDVALIQGFVADKYGNTILTPPYSENIYGALASNKCIVIVEEIVNTDFIRKYSYLGILPGYRVDAVCRIPFGAHPTGISNYGVRELDGYAPDYDFLKEVVNATRDENKYNEWIKYWVLDVKDHTEYLQKLGSERLLLLKGRNEPSSWYPDTIDGIKSISQNKKYNELEMMVIAAARKIKQIVKNKGYNTILAGAGTVNLAAWLANYFLKDEGYEEIELIAEIGFYGYSPRCGDPTLFNHRNIPTCKMLSDVFTIMNFITGGKNNKCLGCLGAIQIDKYGNINTTKIPDKVYFVGSGGANDVASSSNEVIVISTQSKASFVEKVPYITSSGKNVKTLVSTAGIFEKQNDEFVLTAYFKDKTIDDIKNNCSWELKISPKIEEIPPPDELELSMLRLLDPHGLFIDYTK